MQGNRILIFESILIYQHLHPEPVEGLHPLPLHPEPVEGSRRTLHPEPVEGWPVEGWPVEGWPVEGWPVEGWPVEGWPVEGWPVEGWPVEGWPVHYFCWIIPPAHPNRPLSSLLLGPGPSLNLPFPMEGFQPRRELVAEHQLHRASRQSVAFYCSPFMGC